MKQEEKAKAYDEAIKRAKALYDNHQPISGTNVIIDNIFPELNESECEYAEKIKKDIISYLNNRKIASITESNATEKWIAWIEKYGNEDSNKMPIWKHWKDGICGNGEGNPIYLIKNGDSYIISSCLGYECDYIELSEFDKLISDKNTEKNVGKIEPKFKVGDWIVNRLGNVWHIDSFDNKNYKVTDINGNHKCFPISLQDRMHLWTIQDAKPGDVLFQDLMDGKTFIYNGVNPDMTILYSFIISNDGKDVLPYHIGKPNTGIGNIKENKNIIYPATKEQRNLLFEKMQETGYKWDEEKKELKKIDWNPQPGDIFRKKGTISPTYHLCGKLEDDITFGFIENHEVGISCEKISIFTLRNDYELVKRPKLMEKIIEKEINKIVYPNDAWSKEDEEFFNDTIAFFEDTKNALDHADWLRSLKDRLQPKWECDENENLQRIIEASCDRAEKESLIQFTNKSKI